MDGMHDMPGMHDMSPPPQPSPSPMESMEIMRSSFFWGSDFVFFFADWPSGHLGMYILALALLLIISVFYEYLSIPRGYHGGNGNGSWAAGGLVDTLRYTVRVASAYILMLAVMSYNLGALVAVIAGSAIGFYVFRRQHGREEESITDTQCRH